MAKFELKLPQMGESVAEATITNWLKGVGDKIEADETIVEVATDKVDNEVPCEVSGVLVEILFSKDDLVQVGQTIAIIETDMESGSVSVEEVSNEPEIISTTEPTTAETPIADAANFIEESFTKTQETVSIPTDFTSSEKFFSPLVKSIAKEEGISLVELESIPGTGKDGRVTKEDILSYVAAKKAGDIIPQIKTVAQSVVQKVPQSVNGESEIVEMDRMRKLISGYMTASLQISAHVQSFVEVDVTNIVKWRDKVKDAFEKKEGEKLTFTPIFMEAIAKALRDYPGMNVSVDGNYIIKKKNINIGMAAALPNGNLIVPVIKNADQLNLVGMAKAVNDLGNRAKAGKLKPDDTQGGTYTVSNIGSFGNLFGTPIINQPEVGILALGAIRKVPAVIETPEGDFIGIRQKMFLSHSYDHRVVDGALGGLFVKRVAEYLESFDINRVF